MRRPNHPHMILLTPHTLSLFFSLWLCVFNYEAAAQQNTKDASAQAQIDALRREIAELKRQSAAATPKTMQQGTGQNMGGTTTRENLLDQPLSPKKKKSAEKSLRKP